MDFGKMTPPSTVVGSENSRWSDGMQRRIRTLEHVIKNRIEIINGLVFRNGGRGLIGMFNEYIRGIRPRTTKSVVRQVASFCFYVGKIARNSGMKGIVIYLKACQVLLQQSIGGHVVLDLTELNVRPKRTNRGIPRIIPAHVRQMILVDRHIPSIRLWMTLFGLFRILEFPGRLKLSTITDAGVDLRKILPKWDEFLESRFAPQLKRRIRIDQIPQPNMWPILKSGPLTKDSAVNSSVVSLIWSARVWVNYPDLLNNLWIVAYQLGALSYVNTIELISRVYHPVLDGLIKSSDLLDQNKLLMRYNLVVPLKLKYYLDLIGLNIYRKVFPSGIFLGMPIWELSSVAYLQIKKLNFSRTWFVTAATINTLIAWYDSIFNQSILSQFGITKISSFPNPIKFKKNIFWSSIPDEEPILKNWVNQFRPWSANGQGLAFLGKLALKLEPAGKVRVFAMVDAWTQWILYPLHKWIFNILKQIPNIDGTFDQLNPVSRLQDKYADNCEGKTFASIDLSAATDRLPLILQKSVLKVLLKDIVPDSELFSQAWGDLLVKRSYKLPKSDMVDSELLGISYSVGQPMGCLSSWAMLALTHHAIVQYASMRAGRVMWFEDYAILGDDIVIADSKVSKAYLQILSEIGVKTGLAKSILAKSKFVIEFAKKFFVDQYQADMLPLKECIATRTSTALVLEFVRKYNLTLNSTLAFLGFGYKARSMAVSSMLWKLSTRLRVLLVWLSHPKSPIGITTDTDIEKYPYTAWLLQSHWMKTFEHVSHRTLCNVNLLLHNMLWQKNTEGEAILERYEKSALQVVNELDKESPIYLHKDFPITTVERYRIGQG